LRIVANWRLAREVIGLASDHVLPPVSLLAKPEECTSECDEDDKDWLHRVESDEEIEDVGSSGDEVSGGCVWRGLETLGRRPRSS